MAHFVALFRPTPDPDADALTTLYAPKSGSVNVGLWGHYDEASKSEATVKITKGPGKVKVLSRLAKKMLRVNVSGITDASVLQGFLGNNPITDPLPVNKGDGANLAAENEALLRSGDSHEVAQLGGKTVELIPLKKGLGNFGHYPYMARVNGLAVHFTAGNGTLRATANTFESRETSTHFVIDRAGNIGQMVAASISARAQGPGNSNFLSVEMAARQDAKNMGRTQAMTTQQLETLKLLWAWVRKEFPRVENSMATPFVGKKGSDIIGFGLDKYYNELAKYFVTKGYAKTTADSINGCINSVGLSCHWWLDHRLKSCPGGPIMAQMPQVLGYAAEGDLPGADKFLMA